MSIYIASKTKHAAQWKWLREQGVKIISTWIDEAAPGQTQDYTDLWNRCLAEAQQATCLILFKGNDTEQLKGAFIEAGAALAAGRPVLAVGFDDTATFLHHPLVERLSSIEDAVQRAFKLEKANAA